jgi:sugar (pentulose or hexulose) kinase
MAPDLVVGLDSSTTATKAIAWTRDGALAASGRAPIPISSPARDRYEQNPEDWWRSASEALAGVCRQVAPERIAALAISNQRETFVPLDAQGSPVRPAIVWLDQRCPREVPWLCERVGADNLHRLTGKPPDMAPVAYRLAWMLRHEPDLYRSTAMFADVHAYVAWRLTGGFRTSWASADPLGLLDMRTNAWSEPVLSALDLTPERLPALVRPGCLLGHVTPAAAVETGLAPGTRVVAGGGDGQAAGLGVNALAPSRAYLNLGTAVVSGVYSRDYRTSPAWRTMQSCSAEGYYFETSLRAGAFLLDWFAREVCRTPHEALETEAAGVPIGSHGLLTLPYWGAVMNPYWDPQARGSLIGLTGAHRPAHIYRSLLEGIALEQALATALIEQETGTPVQEFVAIGGGAASPLWRRILADASGKTVARSSTLEASSLGAAVCAALGAGWYPDAPTAAQAMSGPLAETTEPDPENAARYAELFAIYRDLYPALRITFARLARL